MSNAVVLRTSLDAYPVRRGKVRDMYDFGGQLLMVSTDRISAFDYVLPTGIPAYRTKEKYSPRLVLFGSTC